MRKNQIIILFGILLNFYSHTGVGLPHWFKNTQNSLISNMQTHPYTTTVIATTATSMIINTYLKHVSQKDETKPTKSAFFTGGVSAVLGYSLCTYFKSNAPCTYTLSGAVCGLGVYTIIDWLFPNTPQKSKMDTVDTDQTNHCKTQNTLALTPEQTPCQETQQETTYQTGGGTEHNQPGNDNTECSQIPAPEQTPCQEQQEETTDRMDITEQSKQVDKTQNIHASTPQAFSSQAHNQALQEQTPRQESQQAPTGQKGNTKHARNSEKKQSLFQFLNQENPKFYNALEDLCSNLEKWRNSKKYNRNDLIEDKTERFTTILKNQFNNKDNREDKTVKRCVHLKCHTSQNPVQDIQEINGNLFQLEIYDDQLLEEVKQILNEVINLFGFGGTITAEIDSCERLQEDIPSVSKSDSDARKRKKQERSSSKQQYNATTGEKSEQKKQKVRG